MDRELDPGAHDLLLDGPRLRATRATFADEARIQACLNAAPDYFRTVERRAPRRDEARRLLEDAEADPQRRVYILAWRDGGDAVGVLDLHLDYPAPGIVHIGLLLIREDAQGRGLGSEICAALESAAAQAGYDALRLSVVDENPGARAFWERVGFWEAGRLDRGVTVYEKALAAE